MVFAMSKFPYDRIPDVITLPVGRTKESRDSTQSLSPVMAELDTLLDAYFLGGYLQDIKYKDTAINISANRTVWTVPANSALGVENNHKPLWDRARGHNILIDFFADAAQGLAFRLATSRPMNPPYIKRRVHVTTNAMEKACATKPTRTSEGSLRSVS
ncbi:uncharacterized protein BDR25DRAFT_314884 [Lindgomyces ingoldianus]|uniref:Uncharacterized protein n=1 Tax=Lindgomyces ingoldianus TaxID=673940 RepID=A0ACB6QT88_9PLEO|nr:uncharacterized protein BDR25DRAFT_314884 [Lindgomyces ingoldianus]KAF2470146.1 hypothetical protein BDR25DRAFT_314884 [Lindgomyces ingoldianus]